MDRWIYIHGWMDGWMDGWTYNEPKSPITNLCCDFIFTSIQNIVMFAYAIIWAKYLDKGKSIAALEIRLRTENSFWNFKIQKVTI